jgi:Na+-translocating ferredoxin:NAD+ oxidoreductase RNF subunit RnfB
MPEPLSRRDFFTSLLPSNLAKRAAEVISSAKQPGAPRQKPAPGKQVAVVAGRDCLACQGTFCSTCVERCPVIGAMKMDRGVPMVNMNLCTGCEVCQEVCPAPTNAIRMITRPAGLPPLPSV